VLRGEVRGSPLPVGAATPARRRERSITASTPRPLTPASVPERTLDTDRYISFAYCHKLPCLLPAADCAAPIVAHGKLTHISLCVGL